MKKLFLFILIVCLTTSLLFGCSPAAKNPPAEPGKEAAPVAADAERPLRMVVSGAPDLDPMAATLWGKVYCYINIYDSLVMVDSNGKIVPLLAEDWEKSEDSLSYTFKLKKGVKFHDGSELLASDVVFSWKRFITMNSGFAYLFKNTIKNVEAVDDYTVKFSLNDYYGPFVETLARLYIVNEDLIMDNLNFKNETFNYGEKYGDFGRTYLLDHDAGSGPYKLKEISQQNYLVADQFKDYHIPFSENAPTYFKITNNIESITVRTMLASKELEISDNWQTPESLVTMDKIDGVDIMQYANSGMQQLSLNCGIAPTDDENFRKALACLVDYDALIKNIFPDSKRAVGPANALTPGSATKHDKNPYNYDIELAKKYLAQSKYANQLDKYPVEFFIVSGVATQEKIALALQAAAAKVGITVKITTAPGTSLNERVTNKDTTPNILTFNFAPYYFDAGATFETHYTSRNAGTGNSSLWHGDTVLDNMVFDALKTVDREERYDAYAKIEEYLLGHCYAIYIADSTERVAYQSNYVKWPAATYFKETGKLSCTTVGYHYWFHDFEVYPDKMK